MIKNYAILSLCFFAINLFCVPAVTAQTEYSYCDGINSDITVTVRGLEQGTNSFEFTLLSPKSAYVIYGLQFTPEIWGSGTIAIYKDGMRLTSFGDNGSVFMLTDAATYGGEVGRGPLELTPGTYSIHVAAWSSSTPDPVMDPSITAYIYFSASPTVPNVYNVVGGGAACNGGSTSIPISLSNSDPGVTYQLFRDNVPVTTVVSSGGPISFGNFQVPGTYTVSTVEPCIAVNMNGSAVISDPRPAGFSMSNDGPKCAPSPVVTLSAPYIAGATYYWSGPYGFTKTTTSNSTSILGLEGTFTYSVYASANGCTTPVASTSVTVVPAPTPAFAGADQNICELATFLNANSSGSWSQVSGPGTTQFENRYAGNTMAIVQVPGTYVYRWTTSFISPCTPSTDDVVINFNPSPSQYTVSGGGTRCANGPGLSVSVNGSQPGISYQLKINGVNSGTAMAGTGGMLTWTNQTTAGTYTIQAVHGPSSCTQTMNGSAVINVLPAPLQYITGGGGTVCTGTPVGVSLSNSEVGINYQLLQGGTPLGSALTGTGSALNWPDVPAGTYTVLATHNSSSCTQTMSGSAVVTINPLPAQYSVGGGGTRCSNGAGLIVDTNGSQVGVSYQLKVDGVNFGSALAGTGSALSWSNLTAAGAYTVEAIHNTGGCSRPMSGSRTITVNPEPVSYAVGGGATVCTGTAVTITLSNSQSGINYQLKRGTTNVGTAVAGTGSGLSWPNQLLAGTYTVVATNPATFCSQTMGGSAAVVINPVPGLYTVGGGGARCEDGPGLTVNINGSQAGVSYQLKINNTSLGAAVPGTGSAVTWSNLTAAGTYTVEAIHGTGGCTRVMNGSRTITVKTSPTIANAGLDNSVCGLSVNLSANTPVTGTGMWTQVSGPVSSVFDNANSPNTLVTVDDAGTYLYAWNITNNGCLSTDYVQIIYNAPVTIAEAGADQIACGLNTGLAANFPLYGNGTWQQINGPGESIFSDATAFDAIVAVSIPGTYIYQWTITNEPCAASADVVQINFVDPTFCSGRRREGKEVTAGSFHQASEKEKMIETASDLKLYPMPVTQVLTIELPYEGRSKVTLVSMNGMLVNSIVSEEKMITMDVSDAAAGLYVLYVQHDGGVVRRLVVKR